MPCEHYSQFRAIEHFGKPLLTEELCGGLESWIQWSLLKIGAWENVYIGTSGPYGGSYSTLYDAEDRNFTDNTVFQAIRKDWIWETGVNYINPNGDTFNPLTVQVYVNGNLKSTGAAGYEHHIDYPLGRVIFQSPQTGTIQAQYSFRSVQVYQNNTNNFFLETQFDTYNPAATQWSQNLPSGDYNLSASNRMQMPAIIIEPIGRTSSKPFEIGGLTQFNKQDVLFHIVCEDRYNRNNLADILHLQKEKTIILYDSSKVYNNGLYPLDDRGMVVSNPVIYPNLVGNAALSFCTARFEKTSISEVKTHHPNLHWSIVRATFEIIY